METNKSTKSKGRTNGLRRAVEELTWREGLAERLGRIEASLVPVEKLVAMETSIEFIKRSLYGNGQPGACQVEAEKVSALTMRIEHVEQKQMWIAGAATAIASGVSAGIGLAVAWLRR